MAKFIDIINSENFDLICGNVKGVEVFSSCTDSRKAKKGSLFIALKGFSQEGVDFIDDAVSRGANAVITDCESVYEKRNYLRLSNVPVAFLKNLREKIGNVNKMVYGNPLAVLSVVGVTGTNGKTTVVYLLRYIFESLGIKSGMITTVKYVYGNRVIPADKTTPDNSEIFDMFCQMVKCDCVYSFMEISSQGIHQNRISGINFKYKVFTNLSEDHLDYHKTLDEYGKIKEKFLFSDKNSIVFVNVDDDFGLYLYKKYKESFKIVSYGINHFSDYQAILDSKDGNVSKIILKNPQGKKIFLKNPLKGIFNVYNILAAVSVADFSGLEFRSAVECVSSFVPPEGRMEEYCAGNGCKVFVDYAHTPDALKKVLETLRSICRGKIIVCFGCGGERDKEKRPKMGEIAESLSDIIIITDDNPRNENSEEIIRDILKGIKKEVIIIKDRKLAIEKGISLLNKNDFLLVAGKGHENYQIVKGSYIPFNDSEIVKAIIDKKKFRNKKVKKNVC